MPLRCQRIIHCEEAERGFDPVCTTPESLKGTAKTLNHCYLCAHPGRPQDFPLLALRLCPTRFQLAGARRAQEQAGAGQGLQAGGSAVLAAGVSP